MSEIVMENTVKREAPEKITKWDVVKCWWKFLTTQFCTISNVSRCGTAYAYSISKILRKLYKNEDDFREALTRHTEFFMTRYDVGGAITGLVIAMEEQRANDLYQKGTSEISGEDISGIKASLMGPFAGVGDTFEGIAFFATALTICTPMAIAGNFASVPICFAITALPDLIIGTFCYWLGYTKGKDFVTSLVNSPLFDNIIQLFTIIGMIVFGAFTNNLVHFSTPGFITFDMPLTDFMDSLVPGITKLIPVFVSYWLLKKRKMNVAVIILLWIAVCIVIGLFGGFTVTA